MPAEAAPVQHCFVPLSAAVAVGLSEGVHVVVPVVALALTLAVALVVAFASHGVAGQCSSLFVQCLLSVQSLLEPKLMYKNIYANSKDN